MGLHKTIARAPAPVDASRWIVSTVAFCSIALFGLLGSQVLPAVIGGGSRTGTSYEVPTVPLLLSIALIVLAWRRSTELKNAASERAQADERAHHLAYKDDVTGLFNRRFLAERLKVAADAQQHALIMLDLDHFKKVNDLYGHAAGDSLLSKLAERMREAAPADAICVRLGGDEFAILLSGPSAGLDDVTSIASVLLAQLSAPAHLDGIVASVGVSIGLASVAAGVGDSEALMRRSDIAMYEAKRQGRNSYIWFDEEMERQLDERNLVEAEMRASILEGRFVPFFQPTLEISTGKVNGFEVLARWDHPTRGIVEPDEFIPVAEATGMISDLSFAVMREALLRALTWPSDLIIAVNVSPVQFKDPLLSQRIIKILRETGFPARRLELEITESAILEDREMAFTTVHSLKNYGVRISLDDFGTGYASLSQLRELPFDRIKIDKSFVASLMDDKQSNAIVHAIATLGRSLDLPITAEGVEDENVHQRLLELGCSDAQGWLFGRAITGQETGTKFFDLPADASAKLPDDLVGPPTHSRRDYARRGSKVIHKFSSG